MLNMKQRAEQLLNDPLEPVPVVAKEFGTTSEFLRLEAKRGNIKILQLSPKAHRIRRSEKLRYLKERGE